MAEKSGPQQTFVLRQKVEDFADWFFPIVDRFPAREKWALGTEIKRCVYSLIHRAIRLQKAKRRREQLYEFDIDLETLRSLIRRAHAARYLSNRRLRVVFERIGEIGKILGALIKREQQGARP